MTLPQSDLSALCAEVCRIAKEEGLFLKYECARFNRNDIEEKSAHNYVSYVDKESEKRLTSRLQTLLPEAGFITEEATIQTCDKALTWVVDPLDGTTNFIHNLAPYCISIALRTKSEVVLGVIYEVCRNECFYAWRKGGAYLNGLPIHVSSIDTLNDALLLMGFPYRAHEFKPMALHLVEQCYGMVGGTRLIGSAAAELCYIACGRAEIRVEAFLGAWDVAAGSLILQEAGGQVSDFDGGNRWWNGEELLATNASLHHDVLQLLKNRKTGLSY